MSAKLARFALVAACAFSILLATLVTTYCNGQVVTFGIMYPTPILPGDDIQVVNRVNNNGPKPLNLVNLTHVFDWAPQVFYVWRGLKIIESNSYADFPLRLHVPEDISSDAQYMLKTVADFMEPLSDKKWEITTVTGTTKIYVGKPPVTVTKEVTKLFMTTAEITKTVAQIPSDSSPIFQWYQIVIGTAGVVITGVVGFYAIQYYRKKLREKSSDD